MKQIKKILLILIFANLFVSAETLRIEIDELSLNKNRYKIVDTRSNDLYSKGHILNAINFPIKLTYENKKVNGKIVNPLKMQEVIKSLGLDVDSAIVIYDDGTFFDAARLFWALEVYGFNNVRLLNAGYKDWVFNNYETSTKATKIVKSNYISKINHKRLATRFQTQIATKNPNQTIIDARAISSFEGQNSTAQRFGHIPQAISIPATHNIQANTLESKLKPINSLKDLYKNVSKKKKVIIYCAIGRVSTTNYFALRELGYDVSNYDASWREWGNDLTLPIINPSKK